LREAHDEALGGAVAELGVATADQLVVGPCMLVCAVVIGEPDPVVLLFWVLADVGCEVGRRLVLEQELHRDQQRKDHHPEGK
jgi:hypothetical protein